MDLERQTGAEPYWRRRVSVLVGIVGVTGLLVWSCSAPTPAAKPPRQAPAAATADAAQQTAPSSAPTPVRSATTPVRSATTPVRSATKARRVSGKHADMRAHRHGSACAPSDMVVTLLGSQQSYRQPADPQFTIYAVNTGGRTCTFDAGPRSLRLVVKSGPVHEWSPADCAAHRSHSGIVRLAHGVPFVTHIFWNRIRSNPGCHPPQQAALPGTYTATVTYGTVHSQTDILLLR